jgi:hypothetical protein
MDNRGHALPEDSWLLTALEQYKALREEILATMGTQQTILGFGLATLGLVIGAGLGLQRDAPVLTFGLIFTFFVPLFSAVVVMIWWGEVLRMVRAGDALAFFEETINEHGIKELEWLSPALGWESALRKCIEQSDPQNRMWRVHVLNLGGIYAAFSLIAVVGIAMGLIKDFETDHALRPLLLVLGGLSVGLGVAIFAFGNYQLKRVETGSQALRNWLSARSTSG